MKSGLGSRADFESSEDTILAGRLGFLGRDVLARRRVDLLHLQHRGPQQIAIRPQASGLAQVLAEDLDGNGSPLTSTHRENRRDLRLLGRQVGRAAEQATEHARGDQDPGTQAQAAAAALKTRRDLRALPLELDPMLAAHSHPRSSTVLQKAPQATQDRSADPPSRVATLRGAFVPSTVFS